MEMALARNPEVPADVRTAIATLLPSLSARALRLSRSRADAEDLVQETVLRALRFETTFQRGTNARAWMFQILESVFITRMRSRTRERRALERFAHDPNLTSAIASPVPLAAVSNQMHSALRSLPGKFRQVVELVDLAEHSYREAADELGVPVGTVMSRLFRARRILRDAVGAQPEIPRAA